MLNNPNATVMPAARANTVKSFIAMEILARTRKLEQEGASVIHLELGEPDFETPPSVVAAAKNALDKGFTHYTVALGDQSLREAIARRYSTRYGVRVSPEQVVIFPGSSPALGMLFSFLLDPGDEVILSNPCYPCYPNFTRFAGGVPVEVNTHEEEGFLVRPQDVREKLTPNTKAIMLNSPCNPTGIVMDSSRMRELAELGVLIISDEIYHGLTYGDAEEHSILEFTDNAVVVNGFSKVWAMTGWRLCYLIMPEHLVEPLNRLMQNFYLCTNTAVQQAGIVALDGSCDATIADYSARYDKRRRYLLEALPALGFNIPVEPRGAFYMLVNARHLGTDSLRLAYDILDKAHVGVTPGIDFGTQSEGYLRISYANSLTNLQEAVRRLGKYIAERN